MRWYRFGTDFFACDFEKRKMYWMYIEFFGKKQAGKDAPPNQSAVPYVFSGGSKPPPYKDAWINFKNYNRYSVVGADSISARMEPGDHIRIRRSALQLLRKR